MNIGYGRHPSPTRPLGVDAHHRKIQPLRRRSSTRAGDYLTFTWRLIPDPSHNDLPL
jgi:hypothetical protein